MDLPQIGHGERTESYFGKPKTELQKKLREGASSELANHHATRHRERVMEYFRLISEGGNNMNVPAAIRSKKDGIQRWHRKGLARTITTLPEDFIHPVLDRVPTIRELARVQTFPDRYVFRGQRTSGNKNRRLAYCAQSQQVGNAIPPMLAESVARAIIQTINARPEPKKLLRSSALHSRRPTQVEMFV